MSTEDELKKLVELNQSGALSEHEFDKAKAKLLGSQQTQASPVVAPTEREQQVKQWALFLHLSQLAGILLPLAGLIAPIVLWQVKKEAFPELDAHGKVIANWIISVLIYGFVCFLLTFVLIGVPLLVVLSFLSIIFPVIGAIKANNGELWHYPLSLNIIK